MTKTSNPYLALREAKIARNQARLKELGLLSPKKSTTSQFIRPRKKSLTPSKEVGRTENTNVVVLRRSRRISQNPEPPNYQELPTIVDKKRQPHVHNSLDQPLDENKNEDLQKKSSSEHCTISRSEPASNSVRAIDIDTERLVIGKKNGENGILGRMMDRTGKEYVINEAFDIAASEEDKLRLGSTRHTRLSFNKYSGVQEWKNAAFLWVNLGGKDGSVVNDFIDDGRQITWFGGSRMHDSSPVILKLLKMGQEATTTTSTSSSGVVLFCRRYMVETKSFSPYVCLGRLGYQSHIHGSHPLSFIWTLLDHDALTNHSEKSVRESFYQIISP